MKLGFIYFGFSLLFLSSCSYTDSQEYQSVTNDKAALGKEIFFDKSLSEPTGQSCASCHAPEKGFSDPNNSTISEGAVPKTFASRNAPSLSYNVFSPKPFYNTTDQTYIGGFFYDGRSPDLQEQLTHPFIGSAEMNNGTIEKVVEKIKKAGYFDKIKTFYGNPTSEAAIFNAVADALVQFETSREVNSFTSKFDYASKGLLSFTEDEKQGLKLFQTKAKCAQCHVLEPDQRTGKVLFTDFSYDNLGIPKNSTNPFYTQKANLQGANFVDLGIGGIKNEEQHIGKFKVPSLRNVAVSAPYYHNGAIKTLKEAIHFYNVRDLKTGLFDTPEYNQNVNKTELGDLKLTEKEEFQIEKFLETLTDHYRK